jgi:nicotinamidase-related amidase
MQIKSAINMVTLAQSHLVVVDMQAKLASVMHEDSLQSTSKNCGILVQAANTLTVPIVVTEQYPQGLGETLADIKQFLANKNIITKTTFSACGEPKFNQQLHRDKTQIILVGIEAHICVQQTALALLQAGKQVFVLEDAILSRSSANKTNAVARMRDAGCVITNTESVIFEWLGNANHEAFKALSKLIK